MVQLTSSSCLFPIRFFTKLCLLGWYKNVVNMAERKGSLGRPGCRWKDNIITDLKENGLEGMDWIHMAQDRDHWRAGVNTVMNLRVP
jgi:hypothetical protein